MDKENKNSLMVINILANIKMVNHMEKENTDGKMDLYIKANFLKV